MLKPWHDTTYSSAGRLEFALAELHRLYAIADKQKGMVLVPIEPTEEMLMEGRRADAAWCEVETDINVFESGLVAIYKAMLAAAQGERK